MSRVQGQLRELVDTLTEHHQELVDKLTEQQDSHFERLEMLLKVFLANKDAIAPDDVTARNASAPIECTPSLGADMASPVPPEREPISNDEKEAGACCVENIYSRQPEINSPSLTSKATRRSSKTSRRASATESIVRKQIILATEEPCDARSVWDKYVPKGTKMLEVLRRRVIHTTILQRLQTSRSYEVFVLVVIISNSIYIGIKTEYEAQTWPHISESCYDCTDAGLAFYWVDLLYTLIFFVEWLLRIGADRCAFFYVQSLEFGWNIFDTLVLAMMLLDLVSPYIFPGGFKSSQVSLLRILRMVRVFRAFRLIRVLKFLRELRIVLTTVILALRSLVWTFCVIALMLYVFAIVMTQGTVEYCSFDNACTSDDSEGLRDHFGTLSKSGLTLFMTMSNGISWNDVFLFLSVLSPIYGVAFVAFVCITLFALLNVINGVFVETTLYAAKLDDIAVIEEEVRTRERYLERLHGIFHSLDLNKDGVLTSAEFDLAFMDERVVALFNAAGIDPENSRILYNLIDRDLDGVVSLDDFWRGCMRLKGEAKALDLSRLQIDVNWLCKNVRVVRNLLLKVTEELQVALEFRSPRLLLPPDLDRSSLARRSIYPTHEAHRCSMSRSRRSVV